jgi:putative transcriptional regulator
VTPSAISSTVEVVFDTFFAAVVLHSPMRGKRAELAETIAGEVTLSEDPGSTLKKWRTDFEITQTELADRLDVSPSVVSDYESGRRDNPGIQFVDRAVTAILDIDEERGGEHIRQYTRVLSAGHDSDVVLDLREYTATIPLERYYDAIDATELYRGSRDTIAGHTIIDSIEAIRRLSSDEFYNLYGESTNRALVFTNVTRGESPLVALRVVKPTPHAVILHGLEEEDVWEHAADLARVDGFSLAVTSVDLEELLERHRELP